VIVDPDFLTHWRTLMLIDELDGDEMAPLYVLRLWGHCQTRRSDTFEMPTAGLKALCRYRGEAEKLEAALVSAGFLERHEASIFVPKWLEYNASLVKNWRNGSSGGRPKKTQEEPNGNPVETQEEPNGNPRLTQPKPIREEIREEVNNISEQVVLEEIAAPAEQAPSARGSRLPDDWVLPRAWSDWAQHERPGWAAEHVRRVGEKFGDYWRSQPGAKGRKSDWLATWRNWIRNESDPPRVRGSPVGLSDRNGAAFDEAKRLIFGGQHATG